MTTLTVRLPWPPKPLWPNSASRSWRARHGAFQRHKKQCADLICVAAYLQLPKVRVEWLRAAWSLVVHCDKKRRGKNRPDRDNVIAACKAALDALQHVGVVENDRWLIPRGVEFVDTDEPKPFMTITVRDLTHEEEDAA